MPNYANKTKAQLITTIEELQQKIHFFEATNSPKLGSTLNDSEISSRAWLEFSPVCTKIIGVDLKLQYMSSAGVTALKIDDINQYYGQPYPLDFYPDPFKNGMKDSLKEAIRTGKVVTYEAPIADVEGVELWFHSTLVPIHNNDGELEYLIVVSTNQTEQKQMEEQLRQSDKMQAIGQLAGGIAHDFNNQLACIQTYIELIQKDLVEKSLLMTYTGRILTVVNRSSDLIRQLLAFSRRGKYNVTAVDVHSIINEVISILSCSIDKKIRLKTQIDATNFLTRGDASQLQNAVLNLAINAWDAVGNSGEIEISTANVCLTEAIISDQALDIAPGDYIELRVTDTGIGMNAETMRHMFEPFFTTKDRSKGTGMGLASVYGTIKNHHGGITVNSEPDKGATFTLYLPVDTVTQLPAYEQRTPEFTHVTANVLFVDDEEMLLESGGHLLTSLGYKVDTSRNGKEACEFYKEHWKNIDVVIMDMIMPEMNGKEAYIEMKKINPDIKCVMISGYNIDEKIQETLDMGINSFIEKPFKQEQLSEQLNKVLLSSEV